MKNESYLNLKCECSGDDDTPACANCQAVHSVLEALKQ